MVVVPVMVVEVVVVVVVGGGTNILTITKAQAGTVCLKFVGINHTMNTLHIVCCVMEQWNNNKKSIHVHVY